MYTTPEMASSLRISGRDAQVVERRQCAEPVLRSTKRVRIALVTMRRRTAERNSPEPAAHGGEGVPKPMVRSAMGPARKCPSGSRASSPCPNVPAWRVHADRVRRYTSTERSR